MTEAEQLRTALSLRTEETKTLESALRTFRESRRNRVAEKPKPSPPVTLSQTPPALVQKSPTSSPKPALLEQRPPAAAPAGAATAPATRQVPAQTPSGRLIWTGFLPAGQVLTVSGGRPSTGNLSGKLPGGPVRVTVHPAELSGNGLTIYTGESRYSDRLVIEEPGPRNSWTRTTIEYDPERAATAETAAVPAQSNNWQQFSVRAIDHPLSVIVIDWERPR